MSTINLIPMPRSFAALDGSFAITPQTVMLASAGTEFAAELLSATLNKLLTQQIKVTADHGTEVNNIRLSIDKNAMPESYQLEILPDRLLLSGDEPGVFYGVQTLLQMINVDIHHIFPKSTYTFNCCRIDDSPCFPWRGFLLDSARHFQSKTTILKLIEQLALYKINRLHWHLVDNFGWRIFLEHYPELVEYDPESWYNAGFYRPEDLREIVDYAAKHFIEVIPEIEMPAHSCTVFRYHPELACSNDDPYKNNVYEYCLSNPETEKFLQTVICDILDIFNKAKFCHLGGDEAATGHWDNCPRCQKAIKERHLSSARELEADFMQRLTTFAASKGITPMVWAGDWHADQSIILQAWKDDTLAKLTSQGNYVVNSWHRAVYLDYPAHEGEDHFDWMPPLPLKQVYEYDPAPPELSLEQRARVLGGETCLWTEKVPEEKIFSKTFPRLHAFSECVWTPREKRSWKDFKRRSQLHDNSIFMQLHYSLKPIAPNAKLIDIARETNVSKTAVSLFINGKIERNKLAMETCARIATAIRSCQYRPSIHARAIQQKNSYFIGIVIPRSIDCRILRDIQEGIQRVFDNENYRLLPMLCDDNIDSVKKCLSSLRSCGVDAFMLFENRRDLLNEIELEGKPMINLIFVTTTTIPSVTVDFQAAGRLAADTLANQGKRNIVLLDPAPSPLFSSATAAFSVRLRELRSSLVKARTAADIPSNCQGVLAISPEALTELRIAEASGCHFDAATFSPPNTGNAVFIDLCWYDLGTKAASNLLKQLKGENEQEPQIATSITPVIRK